MRSYARILAKRMNKQEKSRFMASSQLHKDWSDDERMSFMFSSFPANRASNPTHWDSKVHFWCDVIVSHCRRSNHLTFTLKDLELLFTRKKSMPLCLEVVLSEMYRQNKIQTKLEFIRNSVIEMGWIKWTIGLVIKGVQKVSGYGMPDIHKSEFVVLEVAREITSDIMSQIYEKQGEDLLMNRLQFRQLCKEIECRLRDEDAEVILCQLRRERKISEGVYDGSEVIRLATKDHSCMSPSLTESDLAEFCLQTTKDKLTSETEKMNEEVKCLRNTALDLHKQKNTSAAKTSLKRSKVLEKSLQDRQSVLDTVQLQLDQIRNAETNRMVVGAFSAGATALREQLKDGKLTVARVHDVMDDVHETLEEHREIDEALFAGNMSVEDPDMEELERELDQLVLHDCAAGEVTENLEDVLPSVPTAVPSSAYPMSNSYYSSHNSQRPSQYEPSNRPIQHQERVAELA